jgi:transposase
MLFSFSTPVWFYAKPVDFRKQINGLVIIVADHLKRNPVSSQLFVFRCKSEKKLKMLWWYRNAFWLCHVRMESGRFQFTRIVY